MAPATRLLHEIQVPTGHATSPLWMDPETRCLYFGIVAVGT